MFTYNPQNDVFFGKCIYLLFQIMASLFGVDYFPTQNRNIPIDMSKSKVMDLLLRQKLRGDFGVGCPGWMFSSWWFQPI